jgi:hypothetical protein
MLPKKRSSHLLWGELKSENPILMKEERSAPAVKRGTHRQILEDTPQSRVTRLVCKRKTWERQMGEDAASLPAINAH